MVTEQTHPTGLAAVYALASVVACVVGLIVVLT
jgi:hypothetical protein